MKVDTKEAMEIAWTEKSNDCAEITENSQEVDKLIFSLGFLAGLEYVNKELRDDKTKTNAK